MELQPLLCRKLLKGREKSVCGGDLGKGDPVLENLRESCLFFSFFVLFLCPINHRSYVKLQYGT